MNILFVAVEMNPVAKVGGLADVIGALPKALRELGHDVRVVLPAYKMVEENPNLQISDKLPFDLTIGHGWEKKAYYSETNVDGVPVWLIGTDEWFNKSVDSSTLYQPGGDMHLFFSTATLAAIEKIGWVPDVVHCHDWHTGFVPVLMRERPGNFWDDVSSVFTIHNFAYQGEFGFNVLDRLSLPRSLFNSNQVEAYGSVNFLKAGCVFADRVNTVSPTYAQEIQTAEYGCALEGLMRHLSDAGRLRGILNGIDTQVFNPETDPHIPENYSANDFSGKKACKDTLRTELGLPLTNEPLLGVVSRLSAQKGLDLVAQCGSALERLGCQLVVQGLGDTDLARQFLQLQERFPERIRLVQEFDAALAQRVYAGSDIFLMPSRFEPCGLGQMIAMRYGTIPVVRATGGLKDTVENNVSGFVLEHASVVELIDTINRAVVAYRNPSQWSEMISYVMAQDYGWSASAERYGVLYQDSRRLRTAITA